MDTDTLTRINESIESIASDIRQWNEHRLQQRIEAQRSIIDVEVSQKAETKAAELLTQKIQSCERLTKLEQQRAKWQRETLDYYKQWFFWAAIHLSRTVPAILIMIVCGFAGAFIGLNVLPTSVGCPSRHSPCYHWRLNKDATIAPDKPSVNKLPTPVMTKPSRRLR